MVIGELDVGTTGCKLTIYDDKGNFVHNSYKEYEVSRHSGEHEIDANVIFGAVCEVIKDTLKQCEPSAIGVTTFGETFTMLDENDDVLFPSMLYTDPRGEDECRQLCNDLGEQRKTTWGRTFFGSFFTCNLGSNQRNSTDSVTFFNLIHCAVDTLWHRKTFWEPQPERSSHHTGPCTHVGTSCACSDFFIQKNQSTASLFLLFRKRSRSSQLFACKRAHNAFVSLPTFYESVPLAHIWHLNHSVFPEKQNDLDDNLESSVFYIIDI